jgi:DNA-binding transcriptional LysR family regulator
MLDWNDLRYFLAVAEGGSTLAAGRELRVSQTTVARRIAALEEAVGLTLFERRQAGYALTPAGSDLLGHARSVAEAATVFGQAAAAQARDSTGTVRLTTDELFATALLPPILVELYEQHPEIHIEVDGAREIRNLGEGEAEIALRSTATPQPSGIVGRALCVDDWSLYCSRGYAERHGIPRTKEDLKQHKLIGGGGGNLERAYGSWIRELGLDEQVAIHQASGTGLLAAIRAGFGLAVLPCILGDGDPDLVCCFPPRAGHGRTLWLITHERVRQSPRVRLVIDFLFEQLKQRVRELNLAT